MTMYRPGLRPIFLTLASLCTACSSSGSTSATDSASSDATTVIDSSATAQIDSVVSTNPGDSTVPDTGLATASDSASTTSTSVQDSYLPDSRAADSSATDSATPDTAVGDTAKPDSNMPDTGTPTSDSGPWAPFQPPFILGADISWETQHESQGYTYSDGTTKKSMVAIMAENGFNYIRLRTFVDPSASDGYSPGQNWCGKDDTVTMAKRAKACGMGVFVDFHMSDTWQSLGTNANASATPMAWRSLSKTVPSTPVSASTHDNSIYQAAHDYVAGVMQALVAAGAKPDMVQVGNETNTGMSGISMSDWAEYSALVNAGITAVRETDPKIIVWAQNGRPRPDSAGGSNFDGWVDDYLSDKSPHVPAINVDGICGSTYGTTNNGGDWTTSFSYVVDTYKVPVMSCEYDVSAANANAGATINGVMRSFGALGRGSFEWEPADYPGNSGQAYTGAGRLFDLNGKVYTANAAMAAYPKLAKSYGLPVPFGTCQ